jgi:hypothetical protein
LSSDPNASTSDPYYNNPNTVEVVITKTQPAMFASLVGQGNVTIAARSVALISPLTYCILALDQGNFTGIDLTLLLSLVQFNNCSIGVNATGSSAFTVNGFLVGLSAYTATVAGAFNNACLFDSCSFTWTIPIKTNAGPPFTPIADPYASVAVPTGNPPGSALSITSHTPCSGGTSYSYSSGTPTLPAASCYGSITVSGTANATVPGGGSIAINGINVSGGKLTLNSANYTIVGTSGNPGISVSAGTVTLNAGTGTTYIQGASGTSSGSVYPAISMTGTSGGTLTINAGASGVIDILGGSYTGSSSPGAGSSAVKMTAGTLTMTGSQTSINNILGGSATTATNGQPAIIISSASNNTTACAAGNAASSAPCFALGNGNSNIQAASGSGQPAIQLLGTGTGIGNGAANFTVADNTNGTGVVIGPPSPTTYAIDVATLNAPCGLFSNGNCAGHDLTLGAGTYTIMGGMEVTGGNVTLNPNGTSIGTYIIDGAGGGCGGAGSNIGLCMTFGDLNGQNETIVLTGAAGNWAPAFDAASGFSVDGISLTAPQSGPTAGLAVFQNPNNPGGTAPTNYAVGGQYSGSVGFLDVTGALYFPSQALDFVGVTADLNNVCLQLIAGTISITGLAWLNDTCPAGVSPIAGLSIGLVE